MVDLEVIVFNEFVEVDRKGFKCNAEMIAEVEVAVDSNDVTPMLFIHCHEVFEDLHLHQCLMMEPFLISYHLQRHYHVLLMVKAFQHLTE